MATGGSGYHLPDELWLLIIDNLKIVPSFLSQTIAFQNKGKEIIRQRENQLRRQALYSLCITCHRIWNLATPILYSAFHAPTTQKGLRVLTLFHRTISESATSTQRKRLAEQIHYIENRLADHLGNSLAEDIRLRSATRLASRFFELLVQVVKLASNVQHLNIVSVENADCTFWRHILSSQSQAGVTIPPEGLKHLRYLCSQTNSSAQEPTFDFARSYTTLTRLPLLTELVVSGVVECSPLLSQVLLTSSFKQLQRLEIIQSMLSMEQTLDILLACVNLRHVSLHWAQLDCYGVQAASIIYPGLLQQEVTLETLQIDMRDVRFFRGIEHPDELLGSFVSFHKLRLLSGNDSVIPGSQWDLMESPEHVPKHRIMSLLPPSLEHFVFLLDDVKVADGACTVELDKMAVLWHLMEDCNQSRTSLRTLTVSAPVELRGSRIGQAFAAVGVELQIMSKQNKF